jgi:predicted outer membrane repeat protein
VITLSSGPPNDVFSSIKIGTIEHSSHTYSSPTLTAVFDLSTASIGTYDVTIQFTTQDGTKTATSTTNATRFTIQRTGGATTIYVDADSTAATPDGKSWATAYKTVTDVLSNTMTGDEIWVADGTYKPTTGITRTTSFNLVSGVAMYGGFKGTETSRSQRNYTTNVTILSGDIGVSGTKTDNSYHVLTGADSAILDGFTVTGGYANAAEDDPRNQKGGGIINYTTAGAGVSMTLNNVIFDDNYAVEGGAMYNYGSSGNIASDSFNIVVNVNDSTFKNNSAKRGGAILARVAGNTAITNSSFISNYAEWRGGAINIDYGTSTTANTWTPTIQTTTFDSNVSNGHGGAVYIDDWSSQVGYTSPLFDNCTFKNNRATYLGGAVRAYNKATPKIQNSTFTSNSAGKGGGAISIDYGATVTSNSNTFSGNSSTEGSANVDKGTNGACSGTSCS